MHRSIHIFMHTCIHIFMHTYIPTHPYAGTDLKPLYTGVEWTIGGEAEVTFQISNNHGGGYRYNPTYLYRMVRG